MPVVEASVLVPVDPATAFAVSQTTGAVRLRWDPFIRHQHFLDGAGAPAKGVRTFTRHRSGLAMVSEYVSYNPPSNVGMKMVRGPWFFAHLAGGGRVAAAGRGRSRAVGRDRLWRRAAGGVALQLPLPAAVVGAAGRAGRDLGAGAGRAAADRRVRAGLRRPR